ncbi:DUF3348 domain-containing protein [Cupriavidus pinatubonensis]|uniref:DUF3348 domain-containing protein n=1 Tax=Cupriavidus pinatubonensis TaxID=248026 RepID=UPI001127ED45|nr:DUF3348 domain-containing protein [Cupriavidus pinatubonensis]TPQ42308.1 DUF3348 domain-containing protein [Cupriavidus pinatubonensis]
MLQAPRRAGFSGPTLIRLLVRLTGDDAPESGQSLSDQLGQWLGWTDAIALSAALNGNPPAAAGARAGGTEQADCARIRAALTAAIADDKAGSNRQRGRPRPAAPEPAEAVVDYAAFRQRYVTLQQTMETEIGSLRDRLRTTLAARGAGMTRLSMVDAVMERVLGAREQALLATVPGMLEAHFTRLRRAEEAALANAQTAGKPAPVSSGAWLTVFQNDMQSVLRAELDIRFQPVEALLAALRDS